MQLTLQHKMVVCEKAAKLPPWPGLLVPRLRVGIPWICLDPDPALRIR